MPLRFKGGDKTDKKEKKDKKRKRAEIEDEGEAEEKVETIVASGRIVANGETINGFSTSFLEELDAGDVIIINHPTALVEEACTVSKVLGNRSCLILNPFSANFSTTTAFKIEKRSAILLKKARKNLEDEDLKDDKLKAALEGQVQTQLKNQTKTIQVREKFVNGSSITYRTVNKVVAADSTAEDALNERVKKGRDKFCW